MDSGRILVMRHAEKSGDPLDPHLSPSGRQRAVQLASYIPCAFGDPDFLFATLKSKHSNRPYETLEPLSQAKQLSIDDGFADQDYAALAGKLVSEARFEGGLIVVCWHHGNIPPLCRALGADPAQFPNPWDHAVFNLILQFEFNEGVPKVTAITEPF